MQGTVLYGTGDVRFEDVPEPKITKPTDAYSDRGYMRVRIGPVELSRHQPRRPTDTDGARVLRHR